MFDVIFHSFGTLRWAIALHHANLEDGHPKRRSSLSCLSPPRVIGDRVVPWITCCFMLFECFEPCGFAAHSYDCGSVLCFFRHGVWWMQRSGMQLNGKLCAASPQTWTAACLQTLCGFSANLARLLRKLRYLNRCDGVMPVSYVTARLTRKTDVSVKPKCHPCGFSATQAACLQTLSGFSANFEWLHRKHNLLIGTPSGFSAHERDGREEW